MEGREFVVNQLPPQNHTGHCGDDDYHPGWSLRFKHYTVWTDSQRDSIVSDATPGYVVDGSAYPHNFVHGTSPPPPRRDACI